VLPVAASILVAAIRPKKLWNKAEAEHAPKPLQQGTFVKGGREFQSGLERSDMKQSRYLALGIWFLD